MRGLQNASGFLQQKLASRIDSRYTPKLRFILDRGVKHSIEVSRILHEVLPETDDSDDLPTRTPETDPTDEETINDAPPPGGAADPPSSET